MPFKKKQDLEEDDQQTSTKYRTSSIEDLERELGTVDYSALPYSMTLTAQEVYMIQQAGYQPIQVVFGSIVYSMGVKGLLGTIGKALTRGEMVDFTRMNQDAREIAKIRMLEKAKELGATDVMDVIFEESTWSDFLEVVARGTAVKKVSEPSNMPIVAGN